MSGKYVRRSGRIAEKKKHQYLSRKSQLPKTAQNMKNLTSKTIHQINVDESSIKSRGSQKFSPKSFQGSNSSGKGYSNERFSGNKTQNKKPKYQVTFANIHSQNNRRKVQKHRRQMQQYIGLNHGEIIRQSSINYRTKARMLNNIKFCDDSTYSTKTKFYKNSASKTNIYFATIKPELLPDGGNKDVVIKEFDTSSLSILDMNLYDIYRDMIRHEADIYSVTTELLTKRFTPNIVGLIKYEVCSMNDKLKTVENYKQYKKRFDKFVIVTETGFMEGKGNVLAKYEENISTSLHILFPIIYTLECFYEIGLTHNDLHRNNILVKHYTKSIPVIGYRVAENMIVFMYDVHYVPVIFDFDRASKHYTKYNVKEFLFPSTILNSKNQKLGSFNEHNEKIKRYHSDSWKSNPESARIIDVISCYYNMVDGNSGKRVRNIKNIQKYRDFFTFLCHLHSQFGKSNIIQYLLNMPGKITSLVKVEYSNEFGVKQPRTTNISFSDETDITLSAECYPAEGEYWDIPKRDFPIKTPNEIIMNAANIQKLIKQADNANVHNNILLIGWDPKELDKMMYLPHMYQLPSVAKKQTSSEIEVPETLDLGILYKKILGYNPQHKKQKMPSNTEQTRTDWTAWMNWLMGY